MAPNHLQNDVLVTPQRRRGKVPFSLIEEDAGSNLDPKVMEEMLMVVAATNIAFVGHPVFERPRIWRIYTSSYPRKSIKLDFVRGLSGCK